MDTIRKLIISQIITRLQYIRTANGFITNIGTNVFKGKTFFGVNDVPGITVLPGIESEVQLQGADVRTLPLDFVAYTTLDPTTENANDKAEDTYGDIVFCLFGILATVTFINGNKVIAAGDTVTGITSNTIGRVVNINLQGGSWAGSNAYGTLTILLISNSPYTISEQLKINGVVSIARVSTFVVPAEYGGYIQGLKFISGGVSNYPKEGDTLVMVELSIDCIYCITNNPYTQGG